MTTTRRSTLTVIGGLGALATAGPALAIGEHEDDERDDSNGTNDDDVNDTDDTDDEDPAATAAVRVAHFSPDASAVDVYVDGEQVLADVAYDTVSPYLEIAPGSYRVEITAAGDRETVVFDEEVPVSRAFYTIAAIGELEADTFRALVLTDAGSALIRLAHFSPDAPGVDIVGSEGAPTLFENVAFGEATNYVALPAGTYSLDVLPAAGDGDGEAGGTSPDTDDADDADGEEGTDDAVATVEVTLEPGTAYTAFATGYLEAEPSFAVRLETDGPRAAEAPMDDEPGDDDPDEPMDDDEMDDVDDDDDDFGDDDDMNDDDRDDVDDDADDC